MLDRLFARGARLFACVCLLLATASAGAASAVHSVLLDTDANSATGCPVTTVKGVVSGVEQVLDTTITTTTTGATVTNVARRVCSGGGFGAAQGLSSGGWPVGLGNGASGKAVIETGIATSLLPSNASLRIAVSSTASNGGADAIVTSGTGAPIVIAAAAAPSLPPQEIPALHPLLIAVLAGIVAALGWRARKVMPVAALACISLALVAGIAYAAMVIKDGQIGDWLGVPALATDAAGNAPPNADLLAIHAQFGPGELYFRIDADIVLEGSPPPPPPPPAVNVAPNVNAGVDQSITLPAAANLVGTSIDDGLPNPPATLTYAWSVSSGPALVTFGNSTAAATTATFAAAGTYVLRLTVSDSLLTAQDEAQVVVAASPGGGALPPDPKSVAPPRSTTSFDDFARSTSFLYTGANPIQSGVAPGTIQPVRAAVIRGKVLDRALAPLSGATVSILNHPELGQTLSRADGMYDLAVNGGGKLIVKVQKTGFFEVQRDVLTPWQDFVYAPDVVLTPPDAAATPIDFPLPTLQVARGTPMTDSVGTRRATLLFPAGTTAQFRMPNGSLQPAPARLTVRQTEYTVGASGPRAMPSELPPSSGYTYYLELTADEELAAGAIGVEFNQSVIFYLENFRNFPVGANAPVGFYDRQAGVWRGEPDGRVVKVIAINGGLADLDTDGNGSADNGAGTGQNGSNLAIGNTERQTLATLYAAGQTLWRVQTTHFSPGDINWPKGPPPDAVPPNGPKPINEDDRKPPCDCDPCKVGGSIIECANQTLGEDVPIVGTGMALHYRSDRVPGRAAAREMQIPLSSDTVPASLAAITLEVNVAGQRSQQRFSPAALQSTSHSWDGRDVYGHVVQGAQFARVRVGFEYPAIFQATPADYYSSWALASGNPISGNPGNNTATIFRDFDVLLGAWDARGQGLGGWSLSAHHAYDYLGRVLYLGTGERRKDTDGLAPVVKTIAGNGTAGAPAEGPALASPLILQRSALVVEPDGSVLFTSVNAGVRLLRVRSDGTLQRVAGPGTSGAPLFGVVARDANFGSADKFAQGPDGSIYVTYRGRAVVARIRPVDQIVELFAGTLDQPGFTGDGGPAMAARLNQPRDIAVGSDGSVFIHDSANNRIRRIGPDGIINTIAGNGASCGLPPPEAQCDDGPALQQKIANGGDNHLTVAPDGTLYAVRASGFALSTQFELYAIGTDGVLRVIGGKRQNGKSFSVAEGVLALDASIVPLSSLAVDRNGVIYFAYTHTFFQRVEIRFIDRLGRMRILAGSTNGFGGDGGPARSAKFSALPPAIATTPDNQLVIVDAQNFRIRALQSRYPGFTGAADYLIPASDGGSVYRFDSNGRHLQTLHALTGAALLTFAYDPQGRLATITDGDNNVVTVARNASGAPTAITAPFGQVTQLATDANGWLTQITNPANEAVALVHQANGLLAGMTTPKGQSYTFAYEAATGYLLNDADPAGGNQALARTMLAADATRLFGHEVNKMTALGRTTGYRTERLHSGERVETATATDGTKDVVTYQPNGGMATTAATGSVSAQLKSADPRWGMLAPVAASRSVKMPSNNTLAMTEMVNVTLTDPANVFSLAQLTNTTTLNGRTFSSIYAGATRQFTQTTPGGRTGNVTIDSLGKAISEQFGGLAPSAMTYDAKGRLVTMTMGTGAQTRTTTFAYNAQSYLQSMTDPLGRVTSFTYDGAGRATSQTLPDGRVLSMSYDANGNVASVTPPGRPAHAFSYSAVDLETQYDPPTVPSATPDVTNTSYNVDRQPTVVSRADGKTITPTYDSAGRIGTVAFSRGSIALTYSAATGLLSSVSAPDGVGHSFTYDGSLLLSHALNGPVPGTLAWTYDSDFRIASQSVNAANTVSFAYDADSLLTQAGALVLNRSAANGLLTGSTLGNVSDAWSYNTHAEPVDYQVSVSGGQVYRTQFTRDALGRITQKVETINGVTDTYAYTYDLAGRLLTANKNATPIGYVYDANSNRTSYAGPLGNVSSTTYDAQDRLVQYGATSNTYNNHGDLVTRTQGASSTQYTYDELGNLTRVVLPGGTQIDYVIDGMNRRIGKKVNGTLTKRWLYDGRLRIVAELDGAGALVSRFVYANKVNVPEYVVQGATTYRLVADYLGSPRLMINSATGAIAGTMNHDEYGRINQDTLSSLIPFGFAGGHYDKQTGLTRFGARDYDEESGRWTAKDPIGFAAPQTNLYAYSLADPVNFYDPGGLESLELSTIGAAVVGMQTSRPSNVAPHWKTPEIKGGNSLYVVRDGVSWVLLPEMVLKPGDELVLENPCDSVDLLLWDRSNIRIRGGNRVKIVDPSPGSWHPWRDMQLQDFDSYSQEYRRSETLTREYYRDFSGRPTVRRMQGRQSYVGTKG